MMKTTTSPLPANSVAVAHQKLVFDHSKSLQDSGKLSRDAILCVEAQRSRLQNLLAPPLQSSQGEESVPLKSSPWKQIRCHCPVSTLARTSPGALPDCRKSGKGRLLNGRKRHTVEIQ